MNREPFPDHPIFDPDRPVSDEKYRHPSAIQTVPAPHLQTVAQRLQESKLTILCGRPSVGKTRLALSLAAAIAVSGRVGAAFFSMEADPLILIERLIACEANLPNDRILPPQVRLSDVNLIMKAIRDIYEAPLYIVGSPSLKTGELLAVTRELKASKDIKIVFIDYLSLLTPDDGDPSQEAPRLEIARTLKALAQELHISIVALVQLKRSPNGCQPTVADVLPGITAQVADLVILLHEDQSLELQPCHS